MFLVDNPFARLNAEMPNFFTPELMRGYILLMILFVIGGVLFDIWHKKSAKYFFEHSENQKKHAKREVSSSEKSAIMMETLKKEVLTSGEFSNPQRRISHLLSMYGFIIFVLMTAILIFAYPTTTDGAGFFTLLWHVGALMLMAGGYWFWFGIRVDLASEGKPWHKIAPRADMFILSLLAMSTFGVLWSIVGASFGIFFSLFIISTTFLFAGVIWSKFAHMFFKPAAAYQKKMVWADGSREGLPDMPDLSTAEVHEKFPDIPTYMGKNPPNMGLGIKRGSARNY